MYTRRTTRASCQKFAESRRGTAPATEIDHHLTLIAGLYGTQMKRIGGETGPVAESSAQFIADLMKRFTPRDAIEELLFGQMVLTYGRMVYLSAYAPQQNNVKWAAMMHEATDRAANTFRRQMLALSEYRAPRRANSFTAIGQANLAAQQVVNQGISRNENPMNRLEAAEEAHGGAAAIPARIDPPGEAVAAQYRAPDAGGEGAGEDERPDPRRAVGRSRAVAAGVRGIDPADADAGPRA